MAINNPYDFVPLEKTQPVREHWAETGSGVERYHSDRFSGRLHCLLAPETPLFVHGQDQQSLQQRKFYRVADHLTIPASSLKGTIRSIFEVVSDGCLSSLSDQYRGHRQPIRPGQRIPPAYLPCHDFRAVCPACVLFGMVEQDLPAGQDAQALAGRLFFHDGRPRTVASHWLSMPAAGGGPQPRHGTFYFQDQGNGEILGRKFYYHHRDYQSTIDLYGDGGRPGLMQVEAQTGTFAFHIDFVNLTEKELAYLCYTLLLEEGIRHHLAYGKPYGLGSARIEIEEVELLHGPQQNPLSRFLQLDPAPAPETDAQEWATRGRELWLARPNGQTAYDAFKRVLAWPGADLYKYPSYGWFKHTQGSGEVTLEQYQQGIRKPPRQQQTPEDPPAETPQGDDIRERLKRMFGNNNDNEG